MRWLRSLACVALLSMAGDGANAATVYAQVEGLPNLSVQSLATDAQGYLWAGTEDGAFRFDGHRFLRIELDAPNELPDSHARRLLAVPGAVYIGTPSRLLRYDLKLHRVGIVRAAGADIPEAFALTRAVDGTLYAGGLDGRLWRWRDDGTLAPPATQLALHADAPLGSINGIYAGPSAIWLSTDIGVYRLDPASGTVGALHFDLAPIKNGAVHAVTTIEFPAGVLWIGYWNDGLVRLDLATHQARWFHPSRPGAGALRSTSIYSFAARDDRLYIGSNRGIAVYHPSCDCMRGLNHPSWDQVDGVGMVATDLALEHDGLWVGVWGSGLVRFSATDEVFQHQVKRDNRSDGLAHPMVYALHVSPDRRLWIGTYGGGVQSSRIADQREGESWSLESLPWNPQRVESRFIWSIAGDADELTIGSGYGLFRWRDGKVGELRAQDTVESVRDLLTTRDGRRYIATMWGLFREADGGVRRVAFADSADGRHLPTAIWSLAEQEGELWLGTGQGLLRLAADERVLAWHEAGQRADQLPGAIVWVQKHAADGTLWIGTSGGLVQATGTAGEPRFERHPALTEAGVKSVTSIEFDRSGELWMGSPNGLLRYRPGSKQAQLYDHYDGLVSDQLNIKASASDGRWLYFGGMGGLIAFDPAAVPSRDVVLRPRVARLRLGQGAWQLDATALQLEHQHEPIQVELSALSYARPARVRYAYRWRGIEEQFTELGDAQSVVLSRLPSGTNTLEVRASVSAPQPRQVIAEVLTVDVAPAWHESAPGRIGLLLGIAAVLYAWTRWRTLQARSYARQLEGEVAERTAQLRSATAELVVANARLQQQATLDPLTALANRRQLFDVAAQQLQLGALPSLLLCDLDHFKRINDDSGHHGGDAVLQDFAALLRELAGERGLAVRYGGEEFVLLLFAASADQLVAMAERLLEAARTRRVVAAGQARIRYTVSAGLARGRPGESLDELLRRADRALYRAKREGRDRWALEDENPLAAEPA